MMSHLIKQWFLFVSIILLLSSCLADAYSLDMPGIQEDVDIYNSKVDSAPTIMKNILGSERIDLIVARDDGGRFRVGMDVVDARIDRAVEGGYDNATIIITTSESAIRDVKRSEDRISAFQDQMESGGIRFEAKSWWAQAKIWAVLSSASVLQFGYSLFFS